MSGQSATDPKVMPFMPFAPRFMAIQLLALDQPRTLKCSLFGALNLDFRSSLRPLDQQWAMFKLDIHLRIVWETRVVQC